MSLLVVGVSHRIAAMDLVERVVAGVAQTGDLEARVCRQEDVAEAVLLSTCNRVEVYTEAHTFHGGLAQVGGLLAAASGLELEELSDHLYVHFEDRAVSHLFSLTCGLDSMAVGESQILGQVRDALTLAQSAGHAGAVLNRLFQQALRVGKRAHNETAIDQVSQSLVALALSRARDHLDSVPAARTVLVGAGSMSGLAAATLARTGVADVTVVNRTRAHADRLAAAHGGRSADWADLPALLRRAELVITCTGALDLVLPHDLLAAARHGHRAPLAVIDLAVPHDVDPSVADLPGVRLWGLARLQQEVSSSVPSQQEDALAQVRDLVTGEVADYVASRRVHQVGPTVAALRARASEVVEAELGRLAHRLPELSEAETGEVRRTVQRVVDKLLHAPTVRVKQLTGLGEDLPVGGDYAHALRELFDLDARDVAAVSSPPPGPVPGTGGAER